MFAEGSMRATWEDFHTETRRRQSYLPSCLKEDDESSSSSSLHLTSSMSPVPSASKRLLLKRSDSDLSLRNSPQNSPTSRERTRRHLSLKDALSGSSYHGSSSRSLNSSSKCGVKQYLELQRGSIKSKGAIMGRIDKSGKFVHAKTTKK